MATNKSQRAPRMGSTPLYRAAFGRLRHNGHVTDPVQIFVTGGTFDKEYNELTGELYFQNTHVHDMLHLGRCRVEVEVETLMMIDSLQMTEADRALHPRPLPPAPAPPHRHHARHRYLGTDRGRVGVEPRR